MSSFQHWLKKLIKKLGVFYVLFIRDTLHNIKTDKKKVTDMLKVKNKMGMAYTMIKIIIRKLKWLHYFQT